jgi:hypothetical protein
VVLVVVLVEATFVDTLVPTVFGWSHVLLSFYSYVKDVAILAVVMAVLVIAVLVMAVLVMAVLVMAAVLKAVSMPVLMVAVSIAV